ncbi:hypothetical protein N0V94_000816 [Neodidymelliopsis sp. IMI 364377]|nr:hypothetical protein N0V94_000816 [Neodidymelliopsis sp. IMI 364377]
MENFDQVAYLDSPRSRQSSYHDTPVALYAVPPTPVRSKATIKPPHTEPPAYTAAPYHDSPPSSYEDGSSAVSNAASDSLQQQQLTTKICARTEYLRSPTTTSNRPSYSDDDVDDDNDDDDDDENVPLAHLPLYSRDAPPAYSSVVRQSYCETLWQHIPRNPVIVDIDEEAGLESIHADDVSFKVESIVATAVVMALLVLAGLLLGLTLIRR